jgi:hypothetical protein
MNKDKLKELAEQARNLIEHDYEYLPEESDRTELIQKKLAELIVKECVAIVEHFSDGNEKDQFGRTLYHYRTDIGKEIEQYFSIS